VGGRHAGPPLANASMASLTTLAAGSGSTPGSTPALLREVGWRGTHQSCRSCFALACAISSATAQTCFYRCWRALPCPAFVRGVQPFRT